jgi:O-acetyl-ADP-ribose deacetylase (regulator of RNase III)
VSFLHRTGSIFDSGAGALVNPVNCIGVHGKGLAREFKRRYPWAIAIFAKEIARRPFETGDVIGAARALEPRIIFFPTKIHWRDESRLEWIDSGLDALVEHCEDHDLDTIAIPALGCGLGGLDWELVRPMIEHAFATHRTEAMIYGPQVETPKKAKR